MNIILNAMAQGRKTLTEAEAKEILKHYGVPVVKEKSAATPADAQAIAEKFGYPVVLKGLGARLTHKTEQGLVKLNLKNKDEVKEAALVIQQAAGDDLEGFLVQPMLAGKREFVAGLFHDNQFGPTVMFGLGGIFTEAIEDVVFALAPLDKKDARKMIGQIKAQKLLGEFRGEKAPDTEALMKTLMAVSKIGMEIPQIREIDINPLLVTKDGEIAAVDALIVLGDIPQQKKFPVPIAPKAMGKLFYPKSIAFVGASAGISKWGQLMFSNVLAGNYQGKVFLVNPKGGEIIGRHVYKSVTDIEEPVDLAVVTVPAEKVLALIPEFKAKKIKNVLLISSGFAEVGPEGKRLEEELVRLAREAGIIILGPNTMGISNPHISLYCTGTHVRPKPGDTMLVTQSGNLGTQLLAFAEKEGIGIRAFAGSGNEAMITIEDAMEGFEVDDLTKTVVLYIESIKNGRRFYEAAKRVGKKKPVIALKGGRTAAGAEAAASHTGAMASNVKVFKAVCKQAGIILVDQPMDLLDLSAAFSSLPLPKGKKVGIMTLGGGWGVVASDLCMENGLEVPHLSDEVIARINKLLPEFWNHANPVDLVGEMNTDIHMTILEELLQWDGCDAVIHMGIIGRRIMIQSVLESTVKLEPHLYQENFVEGSIMFLDEFEKRFVERTVHLMEKYEKPVAGVYLLNDNKTHTITEVPGCRYKGVNFITPERTVKALAQMYQYTQWLKG
ncbi:MAG TPA: acetate--CoA ligase family protein [Smithellaceae bacterium]|nr:acetate--CoA ligase family protein [Smithellaceae bacterium]HRS90085.1 acetate--CoA ligase family protein [Smithellaceae bacterium]HRV26935.1 acetate--CoA ligase family protein [Smithellaceae bacterium]